MGMARGLAAVLMIAPMAAGAQAGMTASGAAREGRRAAAVVTITASDFKFDAPDSVAAGPTTIYLVNRGPDMHHVWLVKLEEGKTEDDFLRVLKGHGPVPAWAIGFGGPNAPPPGHRSNATVDLEAGNYVLLCVIPGKDGVPHVMKGMNRKLVVTVSRTRGTMPAADVEATLSDYDFTFAKPLTAGKHTVRVKNTATQSHEIVVVRLADGKTKDDLLKWVEKMDSPPPGEMVAGITGISTGKENIFSADFTPGNYVLICFWPDAKDGKAHFMHGMVKEIKIS